MSAFGDAFQAARSAGKKTFSFNGKLYHTKTKEEMAKTTQKMATQSRASSAPVPSSRPTETAPSGFGSTSTADTRRTPMFNQAADSANASGGPVRSSASLSIPSKRADGDKKDEAKSGGRSRWDPRPKPAPFMWPEPSRRRDWDKKKG